MTTESKYAVLIQGIYCIEENIYEIRFVERIWNETIGLYSYYKSILEIDLKPLESIQNYINKYRTEFDYGTTEICDPFAPLGKYEFENPLDIAHGSIDFIKILKKVIAWKQLRE